MNRNRHLHPSAKKLDEWLAGQRPEIDAHVTQCLRCAQRLEQRSTGHDSELANALRAALAPPGDLKPRLNRAISLHMQSRDDFMLIGEMIGLSWRTVRAVSQGSDDE